MSRVFVLVWARGESLGKFRAREGGRERERERERERDRERDRDRDRDRENSDSKTSFSSQGL